MNKSESIDKLATALNKFQGEVEGAKKSSNNPFYNSKYADLAEVWKTIRKPLVDNGLSVIQTFEPSEPITVANVNSKGVVIDKEVTMSTVIIKTMLMHTSGQWIESNGIRLPLTKNDPQMAGAATTYARRYELTAMLGIHQEDDDGNSHKLYEPTNEEQKRYHVIETKQRKIQEILTKYSKDKLYGFNPDAVKQFIKDKLGEERISACRDLDVLNNAIEVLELIKVNYKPETPEKDIKTLRSDIILLQDELAEKEIDGYQTQKHRSASINKHLGTITVNQCEDMDKLIAYESHLQSKLEG